MSIYINVVFPEKWSKLYTYIANQPVKVGQIIEVPLKNRMKIGVIIEFASIYDKALQVNKIFNYSIPTKIIEFIKKVSEYNICELGEILRLNLKNIGNYEPWYMFEGKIQSVTYLIDKIGKREFDKKIRSGNISACTLNYNIKLQLDCIQKKAYEAIKELDNTKPILLKGNTGSGKTNIYFKIITDHTDGQVFIMMPEISLTYSFIARLEEVFGITPHIWNHSINDKAKDSIFKWAISGQPGIIIGARSALWLPFANLKCIVVDEEHDQSYKQESHPRYQARDMATLLCKYVDAKCILVSATPSLETWLNVANNKYNLVEISKKQPIKVDIVKRVNGCWISPELRCEIHSALANNRQSMVFLNRRGFASSVFCMVCQNTLFCRFCSANTILYKNKMTLCSYCGHKKLLENCGVCQNYKWSLYGIGIEKICDDIKIMFPNAKVNLFSSDNENIAEDIKKIDEVDIIITTQILSKGYTFPNLTLVGIVQADQGITSGDPRNMERIYQLLTQVRGRCGRVNIDGKVILQTNNPDSELLRSIANNNSEWIEKELQARLKHDLPPYFRLIRIIAGSKIDDESSADIQQIYNKLKILHSNNIYIFPPAPTQLHKYQSMYRNSILIRYKSCYPQPIIKKLLDEIINIKSKIIVDVDPYSFF